MDNNKKKNVPPPCGIDYTTSLFGFFRQTIGHQKGGVVRREGEKRRDGEA